MFTSLANSISIFLKWVFTSYLVQTGLVVASGLLVEFKASVCYFYQVFIFSPNDSLQKLCKMLFISSKKLFSFSRYSNFCISSLPSFLPVGRCFRKWSQTNLKVYDITNCLNKNSITHFLLYLEKEKRYDIETFFIDGVSDKKHFCRKIMQKMCSKR